MKNTAQQTAFKRNCRIRLQILAGQVELEEQRGGVFSEPLLTELENLLSDIKCFNKDK